MPHTADTEVTNPAPLEAQDAAAPRKRVELNLFWLMLFYLFYSLLRFLSFTNQVRNEFFFAHIGHDGVRCDTGYGSPKSNFSNRIRIAFDAKTREN